MSKVKVLVQTPHPVFDGKGHPMSRGFVYSVDVDETISNLLSEGILTLASEDGENAPKEETKRIQTNKNLRTQDTTESATPEENPNG
jgi:hypothetical protein